MRAALVAVAATTAVLTLGALFSYSPRVALGVGLGGCIAVLNLYVFAKIVDAFIGRRGNAAPWAVIAVIKVVGLIGAVWLILRTNVVPPLSLTVGFSALIVGITLGSLFGPKPPDDHEPRSRP
ncbi:ATP synthase subunit I [Chondromyces crocatus]|nr:ATP synthase subunit I [Chondromyces crocatus]